MSVADGNGWGWRPVQAGAAAGGPAGGVPRRDGGRGAAGDAASMAVRSSGVGMTTAMYSGAVEGPLGRRGVWLAYHVLDSGAPADIFRRARDAGKSGEN